MWGAGEHSERKLFFSLWLSFEGREPTETDQGGHPKKFPNYRLVSALPAVSVTNGQPATMPVHPLSFAVPIPSWGSPKIWELPPSVPGK